MIRKEPDGRRPIDLRSMGTWLLVAALSGALAVIGPSWVQTGGYDVWQAIVETPSVFTFHGLMLAGFILGLLAPLKWIDLPIVALAMIGLFPLRALALMATGRGNVQWPREFLLYAAWLLPALGGLALGLWMRNMRRNLQKRGDRERK